MVTISKRNARSTRMRAQLQGEAAAAAADIDIADVPGAAAVCPGAVAPEDAILEDDSDLSDGDTLLTAKERKAKATLMAKKVLKMWILNNY